MARQAIGIPTPLIKEGDDIIKIIPDSIFRVLEPKSGDIIGITESIVARSQGNYVTLDDVAAEVRRLNTKNLPIRLWYPIYSRNRFAMILKGIARATDEIEIIMPEIDEVGNIIRNHPFTGMNYDDYYREICENEGCKTTIQSKIHYNSINSHFNINCQLRPPTKSSGNFITLKDICSDKTEYGLLGSNKATEEKLKLFPNTKKAQQLVDQIQSIFKQKGYDVEVMVYADGCFKDPFAGIWEFADPVTSPAYTKGLEGTPNEIKLKAFIDQSDLTGKELENYIKDTINHKSNLFNKMDSQGTTPRRKIDLYASLMDLLSGSGDAGIPIIILRDFNSNYASNNSTRLDN